MKKKNGSEVATENKKKTKLCKYCKTEIDVGAKICPNCKKKQGGITVKGVIIALVVLALIGAAAGGNDDKKVGNTTNQAKNPISQDSQEVSNNNVPATKTDTEQVEADETAEILQEEPPEKNDEDLSEQDVSDDMEPEDIMVIEPKYKDDSIEKGIQDYAANIIIENYTDTDIHEIAINENLGTEEGGDYIILARLTWNVKNSGSTSKKMLEMYSSDFAARIGSNQPAVNEVAIFWTVPYLDNANAKWAYERKGEGMYLSDNMMDSVFN